MRRWLEAGRRRGARGAAVVDFVLVLVVLIPIVLGIILIALVLHVRNTLAAAASEGARYGATAGAGAGDGVARTRSQIREALDDGYARQVTAHRVRLDGVPALEIRVTAEVPALGLGGPSVTIEVSGHAVLEQP